MCLLEPRAQVARTHTMSDIDEGDGTVVSEEKQKRRGAVNALGDYAGVSIRVVETHSKLVDEFGQVQGSIYPQPLHIHHESIKGAAMSVCNALWDKIQAIGYITIRFLGSWDESDQMVRLLGSELSFGLSPLVSAVCINSALRLMSSSEAITSLMRTGRLQAPSELRPSSPSSPAHGNTVLAGMTAVELTQAPFFKLSDTARTNTSFHFNSPNPVWSPQQHSEGSYLYLPGVHHAPLRYYSACKLCQCRNLFLLLLCRNCRDDVFFKLCKLNNVAYDPVHQTGVMFFLVDSVSSGLLSMLVVGGTEGAEEAHLLRSENSERRQLHPPAIRARLNTLQLAVHALTFINRSFGKDSELIEAAGFEGGAAGAVHNAKSSDQAAAKAYSSLSSVLMSLKRLLKKEQKIADAFADSKKKAATAGRATVTVHT